MGPIFFNIYTNDLPNVLKNCNIAMYADDVSMFLKHKDSKKLFQLLQIDLNNISDWYASNHLAINIKKSNFIIFTKKMIYNPTIQAINNSNLKLSINNIQLDCMKETKYLGLLIDFSLSWENHIININKKINKQIGILYKIRHLLPISTRLTFYYANINSHLIYALPIWGANYKCKLKAIVLAQKRAIRLIDGASYLAHTNSIYTHMKF